MLGAHPVTDAELTELATRVAELSDTDPACCIEHAGQVIAVVEAAGNRALLGRMLCDRGYAYSEVHQGAHAAADYQRALEISFELSDLELEAIARNGLGNVKAHACDFTQALAHYETALRIRRQREDSRGVISCLNNIASCHTSLLQFDHADSLYREVLTLAQQQDDRDIQAITLINLAEMHVSHAEMLAERSAGDREGLVQAAVADARAAARIARELDNDAWFVAAANPLAHGLLLSGEVLEATSLAEYSLAVAPRLGLVRETVVARVLLGRLLLARGEAAAAVGKLQHACAEAESTALREPLRDALRALADAQAACGQSEAALATFRRYHRIALALRDRVAEQRAEALAASLQLERTRRQAEVERSRALELETANRALLTQALQDPLTGLPNRRHLELELERLLAHGAPVAFVIADVDHFKAVNDSYSHPVGDAVLREIGNLLRQYCRDGDFAARLGGEEFALVLGGVDCEIAAAICERIRSALARHDWAALHPALHVSMSFGVASSSGSGDGLSSLFARADAAMYRAKRAGRNRVLTESQF
jgi:diguanylate cyclase (GGDEF)-like protein